MNLDMSTDELIFFDGRPEALKLYEFFVEQLFEKHQDIGRKIGKTQISFTNPKVFSCISFAKIRKAADRPKEYIVVTFGLHRQLQSPRIDVSTEPYPGRWTHHVLIAKAEEIDGGTYGFGRGSLSIHKIKMIAHRIRSFFSLKNKGYPTEINDGDYEK